ncbi:MAG: flavodoxin domain-containing protein [Bacteroidales bacterium]|nr:flavodoxin domain-containing protein [Bacteroidales bacterium]
MKRTIVIYYSNNGSNKYLATKIARDMKYDIEAISPRIKAQLLLMMGMSFGIKKLKANLNEYERIILCGPIWMGKFIAPLKGFVSKYKNDIKELIFVSCCGSSDKMKDDKFGHGLVFNEIKELLKGKCTHCEAFPVSLVLPDDKKEDADTVMLTRLSDDNFKGAFLERYNEFIKSLS